MNAECMVDGVSGNIKMNCDKTNCKIIATNTEIRKTSTISIIIYSLISSSQLRLADAPKWEFLA